MCICPSICPSYIPPVRSCPRNSPYVFHRTDLKFYRLPSYHMKMCIWFLIFVSSIFGRSYGPCWLIPCPHNSCHILCRIGLKLCRMFCHDLKMCMWFWIFSFSLFLTKLWPFVIIGIFPTFEPFDWETWISILRRRRGTIEMTLVRPCVHLSIHLSVLHSTCPSVRPILSPQLLSRLSSDWFEIL